MRKFFQWLLTKPVIWINDRLSGAPKRETVFKSLSDLYLKSFQKKNATLKVIPLNPAEGKFIVFSDQHKGNHSWADDFHASKKNYMAALAHYNSNEYTFINMGDSEELWKFPCHEIIAAHADAFAAEAAFQPDRMLKTFGNHDITWKNSIDVSLQLKKVFNVPFQVYEGVVLRCRCEAYPFDIFLTHGHQGDLMSDNNAFSTWVVAHIWMPLQRYLRINPNTPRNDYGLRNEHNKIMYEWSSLQENLLLVTGHTHQPVFASGRYFDHPSNNIPSNQPKEKMKPGYFNTGCCCFNDGDITGIEISEGMIRLVKWYDDEKGSQRKVLEEIELSILINDLEKMGSTH